MATVTDWYKNYTFGRPPWQSLAMAWEVVHLFASVGKVRYDIETVQDYFRFGTILVACDYRGRVAGALTVGLLSSWDTIQYREHIPRLMTDPCTLELVDLAVMPTHRGHGLASGLLRYGLSKFRMPDDKVYKRYITTSRVPPRGKPTSLGILKRMEFEEISVVEGLYAACNREDDFCCPDCDGDVGNVCECKGHFLMLRR